MIIQSTELPHRGVLEIQGEDKASFLQGLISNDIHQVSPDKAIYATLLTPQGRFLYDFCITEKGGSYFLDCEAARLDILVKKLSLYKLRSNVNIHLRPDLKVFALWGKDVGKKTDLKEKIGSARGCTFMDPRLITLGARVIGEKLSEPFRSSTPSEFDLYRLTLGIPEGGWDLIPEKSILLESGLDELNAISWTKGCYMGQELNARTKHIGQVRKRLFPVEINGSPPSEGTEIFMGETSVGVMRTHRDSHGLALLRLEAYGKELTCGNALLKSSIPHWMRLDLPS